MPSAKGALQAIGKASTGKLRETILEPTAGGRRNHTGARGLPGRWRAQVHLLNSPTESPFCPPPKPGHPAPANWTKLRECLRPLHPVVGRERSEAASPAISPSSAGGGVASSPLQDQELRELKVVSCLIRTVVRELVEMVMTFLTRRRTTLRTTRKTTLSTTSVAGDCGAPSLFASTRAYKVNEPLLSHPPGQGSLTALRPFPRERSAQLHAT